jgi:hypothetical protein
MFEQSQVSQSVDGSPSQRRHHGVNSAAALDIPELKKAASIAHVFPVMANHSLLSVGQLCNEGYTVTFRIDSVIIHNSQGSQILKGARELDTGLWWINLRKEYQQHPQELANNKANFSPTKSAFLQAVKNGHLITWPGLIEQAINKNLKLTPATAMGHINQRRQKIRSTSKTTISSDMEDVTVTPAGLGTKTHLVYAVLVDQGQLYKDLTGKFPVRSSKGNWYVMVCYVFDCNYIKVVPMRSRSASEWVKAYDLIHQELTYEGFKPKLQTQDNKHPRPLKTFSQLTTWNTNLFHPIVIGATPLKGKFALSKNTLLQDWHPLTHIFLYICGNDCYRKQK